MSGAIPAAPGSLGVAARPDELLDYFRLLEQWLTERRAHLDQLDAQVLSEGRAELTPDMALAMALWQAVKSRQQLLMARWDSGRVGAKELEHISSLIWGRLDTASAQVAALQSMAVSLPEAGRLCDALVAQLRSKLNSDPNAEQQQLRLRDLGAQLERIRDQIKLEPQSLAPPAFAKHAALASRAKDLAEKRSRGGDITGLLGSLEIDAAKLERDLIVKSAQRREARDLLAKTRERISELTTTEATVRNLTAAVAAAVWPVPVGTAPSVDSLGPVPNTLSALSGYFDSLGLVAAELAARKAVLSRALTQRDGLEEAFKALRSRAETAGIASDPVIADLAGLIERRLAASPVATQAAQQLLAALTSEIDFRSQAGQS